MKNKAFSLIEISIVIIIMGLLFFSVSSGFKMIENYKLKSVFKELNQVGDAIKQFNTLYEALPGDFHDAYFYFGDACGRDSPAPNGCNGNNDGIIQDAGRDTRSSVETFRFWQHLKLADLIDGNFSGVIGSEENGYHNSENSYNSKYMNYNIIVYTSTRTSNLFGSFFHPYNNIIVDNATYKEDYWTSSDDAPFTIREVYFLDSKFDDGEPLTGYLIPESSVIVNRWGDACGFGDGSWNFNNQTGCKLIVNGKLIFN